jgi:hypothetical protein
MIIDMDIVLMFSRVFALSMSLVIIYLAVKKL